MSMSVGDRITQVVLEVPWDDGETDHPLAWDWTVLTDHHAAIRVLGFAEVAEPSHSVVAVSVTKVESLRNGLLALARGFGDVSAAYSEFDPAGLLALRFKLLEERCRETVDVIEDWLK